MKSHYYNIFIEVADFRINFETLFCPTTQDVLEILKEVNRAKKYYTAIQELLSLGFPEIKEAVIGGSYVKRYEFAGRQLGVVAVHCKEVFRKIYPVES